MDRHQSTTKLPAPCIVDCGIVVDKRDMQKLLSDLGRVRYIYTQDAAASAQGEGVIVEVFADSQQATLVANCTLYLNVCSFDYLELKRGDDGETTFELVQDRRLLSLKPLSNPLQDRRTQDLDEAALEAVFDRVMMAGLDARNDDDDRLLT